MAVSSMVVGLGLVKCPGDDYPDPLPKQVKTISVSNTTIKRYSFVFMSQNTLLDNLMRNKEGNAYLDSREMLEEYVKYH